MFPVDAPGWNAGFLHLGVLSCIPSIQLADEQKEGENRAGPQGQTWRWPTSLPPTFHLLKPKHMTTT